MREKPPFSSYFDFFPYVWEGDLPYPPHAYFDFALRHAPAIKHARPDLLPYLKEMLMCNRIISI